MTVAPVGRAGAARMAAELNDDGRSAGDGPEHRGKRSQLPSKRTHSLSRDSA
jgi:hypothetical protein